MASWSFDWGQFNSCGAGWGRCTGKFDMNFNNWTWKRDTSNCEYAKPTVDVAMSASGSYLSWGNPDGQVQLGVKSVYFDGSAGPYNYYTGKGGKCHASFNYSHTHPAVPTHVQFGTSNVLFQFYWGHTGNENQYVGTASVSLPTNMRVLSPTSLSVSYPKDFNDKISTALGSWSDNPNIGGTPTTYPKAKVWNFALELLDADNNYLAHQLLNTKEVKEASWDNLKDGFYTAEALVGTVAAQGSKYTLKGGYKYKLRVIANNNMNKQIYKTSSPILFDIPTPTVEIDSFIYDPNNRNHANLTFSWAKSESGSDEVITYEVIQNGEVIESGTLVEHTDGKAQSGTHTVTVPSGEYTTVVVTNKLVDGTMSKSASVKDYAPLASAAFLGYEWDELRHICKVTATAPGSANTRLRVGYKPNSYDLGNTLTQGNVGTITITNPDHGTGQILYLEAIPEATNGFQFTSHAAKLAIAIPNPILGVTDAGSKKQYVVDIIEHKTDDSVTPKWQNTWPRWVQK